MRYMALDVGDVRIGVAISDELGSTSLPHSVIERTNDAEVLNKVTEIINKYKVDVLVVGNPINLDGTTGARSKKTEQFYNYIKKRINIKSLMFDERLTTLAAQRILLDADVSRKKRKEVIDKLAAQQILYSYIEYTKKERN
ncbi:MAG: Holliday junction resolvase RuvX [Eubacteriaceae bacterium]|nr:Holliday junction resolvase RuvX [Eubacteriaceae bacterium]